MKTKLVMFGILMTMLVTPVFAMGTKPSNDALYGKCLNEVNYTLKPQLESLGGALKPGDAVTPEWKAYWDAKLARDRACAVQYGKI